jgi:hypothetical protein
MVRMLRMDFTRLRPLESFLGRAHAPPEANGHAPAAALGAPASGAPAAATA